uniref:Ubiquitin-like protease family profile domain-containing protein n=1 Tax=Lactuca sativa TaxID=4236 RepID=A0A9R1XMV1_LACSA|nr:hypothetical protein LSAT_V11C400161870 [Lactuca sativa]
MVVQVKHVFYVQDQEGENLHVVGFTPHRMYKYGSNGETDDMLEFDATFNLTQDSALLDLDDDFLCTRPDGEGILILNVINFFQLQQITMLCFCDMESDSASDHDEDSKQRGPTTKAKANKVKLVVTYNKKRCPAATKLSTFEGLVARTMVPITYESWLEVSDEVMEGLWQYVLEKFVVEPKSRKQTLQSIGKKWRNFKHYLYAKFIKNRSKDPKANQFKPPKDYPFIKKEDWKIFVSHRGTKKWEKSMKAKNTRAHHKYHHRLSRKGYVGLIIDIMQETGKTEEEIDKTLLWKKARELKTGGYESDVKMIDELQKSGSFGEVTCGTHDVLTEALGTREQCGHVRGMGKFITTHKYFYLPKNVKYYLDIENERVDKRINKLEDDLEKLKRGVLNVSEAASCQVGGVIEDVEKEPRDESLDNSCLLVVEFAANVVAKGTIMKYSASDENIEVMMETIFQGEALIPIPLEEEQRCTGTHTKLAKTLSYSMLCPVVGKPVTPVKEGATLLKEEIGRNKKEKGTRKMVDHEQKEPCDVEELDDMEEGNGIEKTIKKKEKQNMKTRIRIEKSSILKMTAMMADGQVTKVDSIKLQSENDLFGYDSYTYLNWDDFEAVLTMDELTGAIIVSYMMVLFNKMKYGSPERDHGICFVNPTLISPRMRKGKSKNIDDASRGLADWLSKRQGNDIIFMPYNPGRHWVLGVLDMKSDTCYYLDSLSSANFNMQLKQIVDSEMVLYATQSGSNKRVKLNWCPVHPGGTKCGYYMLRFMKEIVEEGIEVLVKDNIGDGKVEYTTDDIDEIREE